MDTGDPLERWRAIPLEAVATALGYRKDPADRTRFKRRGSVISVTGPRFFDHLRNRGGGGAIDLVIHATGCRFPEALRFLQDHAGDPGAGMDPTATRTLRLPQPCPRAWPAVRHALVRQRALSPELLEACRTRGLVHADHRHNAVFICRNAGGKTTGAEILGTRNKPFRGMAPGSRKAKGGFWIPCDRNTPDTVILTESAVDALSARSLRIDPTRENGAVVVSTAGTARAIPPWIEQWKPRRIVCAWDADCAGDKAARRLARNDARVVRLRPDAAKDWNDILQRKHQT